MATVAELEAKYEDQTPEASWEPTMSKVTSALTGTVNGLSLGLAPYIRAIPTMRSGESYSDSLARAKSYYANQQKENPISYTLGSLAGGAIPAVATGGTTIPSIIARNAVVGGVQGGLSSNTLGDVGKNVAEGAGTGALFSGASAGLVQGAGALKNLVGRNMLSTAITSPKFQQGVYEDLVNDPNLDLFNNYTTLFGNKIPKGASTKFADVKASVGATIMPAKANTAQLRDYQDFMSTPTPSEGMAPYFARRYKNPENYEPDTLLGADGEHVDSVIKEFAQDAAQDAAKKVIDAQPSIGNSFLGTLTAEGKYGAPGILYAPAMAFQQGGVVPALGTLGTIGAGAIIGAGTMAGARKFTTSAMQDVVDNAARDTGSLTGAIVNQAAQQYQTGSRLQAILDQQSVSDLEKQYGSDQTPTAPVTSVPAPMEARADGGPVNAGQPYLVGENGPEVVVPAASGTVIPNQANQETPAQAAQRQALSVPEEGLGTNIVSELGNEAGQASSDWATAKGVPATMSAIFGAAVNTGINAIPMLMGTLVPKISTTASPQLMTEMANNLKYAGRAIIESGTRGEASIMSRATQRLQGVQAPPIVMGNTMDPASWKVLQSLGSPSGDVNNVMAKANDVVSTFRKQTTQDLTPIQNMVSKLQTLSPDEMSDYLKSPIGMEHAEKVQTIAKKYGSDLLDKLTIDHTPSVIPAAGAVGAVTSGQNLIPQKTQPAPSYLGTISGIRG